MNAYAQYDLTEALPMPLDAASAMDELLVRRVKSIEAKIISLSIFVCFACSLSKSLYDFFNVVRMNSNDRALDSRMANRYLTCGVHIHLYGFSIFNNQHLIPLRAGGFYAK